MYLRWIPSQPADPKCNRVPFITSNSIFISLVIYPQFYKIVSSIPQITLLIAQILNFYLLACFQFFIAKILYLSIMILCFKSDNAFANLLFQVLITKLLVQNWEILFRSCKNGFVRLIELFGLGKMKFHFLCPNYF